MALLAALAVVVVASASLVAQSKRDISVTGKKYTYVVAGADGPEIAVRLDDLVTVTFSTDDIPHSFTISDSHYRIDRRAEPGKPATFRFRADKAGQFEIRCVVALDERCQREMRGRLTVAEK
jgi:heme/copper-type cytochrome/quinol oxidase subunit 2